MDNYWEQFKTPFLCFAGYSGVGKTTLIERLIKQFKADKIRIGYYKHDAHRFDIDKQGKDTWRCNQAGAGIVAINDQHHFAVVAEDDFRKRTITHALEQCDCILIEGYKQSPFNKVVFLDADGVPPIPLDSPGVKAIVHQGSVGTIQPPGVPFFHRDSIDEIYLFVKCHFSSCAFPLYGAVFVGGQSRRMGKPKFSLPYNGKMETERMVDLLGLYCEKVFMSSRADLDMGNLGSLPHCERINDDHTGLGPVGGLATLMGGFPNNAWLITACDMPFLKKEDIETIVQERDPLRYGTCYTHKCQLGFEPMCAIYEPKFILPLYEAMSRRELSISRIISELPFKHVRIEEKNRHCFMNVNTPEEYETAKKQREEVA